MVISTDGSGNRSVSVPVVAGTELKEGSYSKLPRRQASSLQHKESPQADNDLQKSFVLRTDDLYTSYQLSGLKPNTSEERFSYTDDNQHQFGLNPVIPSPIKISKNNDNTIVTHQEEETPMHLSTPPVTDIAATLSVKSSATNVMDLFYGLVEGWT
ncbi:unnamed protein product [Mytilus coruscus]|uniref:Uncharacterized protein n=1 Tax=Mytilus coruscus TaxID=42192 RepID=A0A6J8CHJ2_MYTCO|nr:unnamed protein product [Mytilus coruscus]